MKTNMQKIRERPLRYQRPVTWMLTNYGIQIRLFDTRREARDFAEADGRDMEHHEIRKVTVRVKP